MTVASGIFYMMFKNFLWEPVRLHELCLLLPLISWSHGSVCVILWHVAADGLAAAPGAVIITWV